jgi:hypothetical protein
VNQPATKPNVSPPRTWRRTLAWGGVLGLCLALAFKGYQVLIGQNLHEVVPGRVYRSAQLSGNALSHVLQTYHIRTVINLRGCSDPWSWYLEECRTTHDAHVNQEDVNLSAGRLPPTGEFQRLVEILDRTAYPILIHCKRGADRTGLVSATVLLLQDGVSLACARRQLSSRYGHVSLGRTGNLDYFLDLYEDWLQQQGQEHSPAIFRNWLRHEYCGGACRCALSLLDPPAVPCDVPIVLRVRAQNTSRQTWNFRAGKNAGFHVGFVLWDPDGTFRTSSRAALYDAEILPGQCIDAPLPLPALRQPGRYRLQVDLVDERMGWFYQLGSEPLETELLVHPRKEKR